MSLGRSPSGGTERPLPGWVAEGRCLHLAELLRWKSSPPGESSEELIRQAYSMMAT